MRRKSMKTRFGNLFAALREISTTPPPDPEAFLLGLTPVGTLPPSPLTWGLFALMRYWQFQAGFASLAAALRLLDEDEEGTIPGLPEWTYTSLDGFQQLVQPDGSEIYV